MDGATKAAKEPEIGRLCKRTEELAASLTQLRIDLSTLQFRLFGGPKEEEKVIEPNPPRQGAIEQIAEHVGQGISDTATSTQIVNEIANEIG